MKTRKEIAQELGVNASSLRVWLSQRFNVAPSSTTHVDGKVVYLYSAAAVKRIKAALDRKDRDKAEAAERRKAERGLN